MKRNKDIILIVISLVISFMAGYVTCEKIGETYSYNMLDSIEVTGIQFRLNGKRLICDFVPEMYSNKITYKVNVIDCNENSQVVYDVNVKNGQGSISAFVQNSHSYKIILTVDNSSENRNIILAEELFVDLKGNSVSVIN